jgi:hypothetical protein
MGYPGPQGPQGAQGAMQSRPLSAGLGQPYGVSPYGVDGTHGTGPAAVAGVPAEGKRQAKKSSVVRDIAIGVSIAAAVLASFVVVKLTVLDKDEPSPVATLRVNVHGASGTLTIDGERIDEVSSSLEIPASAGARRIKVTAADGRVVCDQSITLAAGEIKVFACGSEGVPATEVDARVSTQADAASAMDAGAKGDAGSAVISGTPKIDPKADPKIDPKADPKIDPKADPKIDPKADPKIDPKVNPKVDPKNPRLVPKPVKKPPTPLVRPPKDDGLPVVEDFPEPTSNGKGYLVIMSDPAGAQVLLDGIDTGKKTPIGNRQRLTAAAGKRKLTLVLGENKWSFMVDIEAGQTEAISKTLRM